MEAKRNNWSVAGRVAVVTVGYYVISRIGLLFAIPPADVTPIWPASGIAVASVLRLGWVVSPGIFLAATTVALGSKNPLWVAAIIGVANTLEPLVAAWLVRRVSGGIDPLERGWDAVKFWVLAGWSSCAVGATIGLAPLCVAGLIPSGACFQQWWAWWLGDVGGVVLVAPLVLAWTRPTTLRWTPARLAEVGALTICLVVVCEIVFVGWVRETLVHPLPYLILPLLVWSAFRFSQRETTTVMAVAAGLAVWGTAHGVGPFRGETVHEAFLLLQSFINVTAVTGLAMAALVAEHRGSIHELRQSKDELEKRVRERTADLVRAKTALEADIQTRARLAQERERLVHELQVALANVKTLTGLLPICASCKRIRNDQGYWDQVEIYITKRSDAKFTHGTCPECARRLYPGLFDADTPVNDL